MLTWVIIGFLCYENNCEQIAYKEVETRAACYELMDVTHDAMREKDVTNYLLICTRWAKA
jgi:hypothetical protein